MSSARLAVRDGQSLRMLCASNLIAKVVEVAGWCAPLMAFARAWDLEMFLARCLLVSLALLRRLSRMCGLSVSDAGSSFLNEGGSVLGR